MVVIIFTITRASGLEWQGKLDVVWEVYFQIVAAEVGLILVSMTAFRTLFVSRSARKQQSPQRYSPLLGRSKAALKRLLDPRQWTSKYSRDSTDAQEHEHPKENFEAKLPAIPGGEMTGMRTFIDQQGVASQTDTEFGTYETATETSHDDWPLWAFSQLLPGKAGATTYAQRPCSHCGQGIIKDAYR